MKHNIWIFCLCFSLGIYSQSTAIYNITFTSEWNEGDHGTLPSDAHWSKLVGVNHNELISYWVLGQEASSGIENISETGNNTVFNEEVLSNIGLGNSQQYIDGPNLNNATGTIQITNLEFNYNYPFLTLASMIAPSPDWFIGVSGLMLLDETGAWKSNIILDLYVLDAGTENGNDYAYDNEDTIPQNVITSKRNVAPFSDQRVGSIHIALQSILHLDTYNLENSVSVFPNPTKNKITILSRDFGMSEVYIYNMLGNTVLEQSFPQSNTQIDLDLSALKKGIYLLRIVAQDGNIITKKLLRN